MTITRLLNRRKHPHAMRCCQCSSVQCSRRHRNVVAERRGHSYSPDASSCLCSDRQVLSSSVIHGAMLMAACCEKYLRPRTYWVLRHRQECGAVWRSLHGRTCTCDHEVNIVTWAGQDGAADRVQTTNIGAAERTRLLRLIAVPSLQAPRGDSGPAFWREKRRCMWRHCSKTSRSPAGWQFSNDHTDSNYHSSTISYRVNQGEHLSSDPGALAEEVRAVIREKDHGAAPSGTWVVTEVRPSNIKKMKLFAPATRQLG
jgi:hypothetical protein